MVSSNLRGGVLAVLGAFFPVSGYFLLAPEMVSNPISYPLFVAALVLLGAGMSHLLNVESITETTIGTASEVLGVAIGFVGLVGVFVL